MSNTEIGLLILGLGVVINFGIKFYELFYKPQEILTRSMTDQEQKFIDQLHEVQLENLRYQQEILKELAKMTTVLSVSDSRMEQVFKKARENKENIKAVHLRVSAIERHRDAETQTHE